MGQNKLRFITLEKLLEMKANEEAFTLVDALPTESYEEGHIPGAVSIPSDDIAAKADEELTKEDVVVTYCASYSCKASTVAARKLLELGYEKTLDYKAGKKGWTEAGLELET